eukprot:6486731-Amphidinium_carterae.1
MHRGILEYVIYPVTLYRKGGHCPKSQIPKYFETQDVTVENHRLKTQRMRAFHKADGCHGVFIVQSSEALRATGWSSSWALLAWRGTEGETLERITFGAWAQLTKEQGAIRSNTGAMCASAVKDMSI